MTRRSVIFRSEGLELVLVFWGSACSVSSTSNPAVSAPAAFLKKERRPWEALPANTFEGRLLFIMVSLIRVSGFLRKITSPASIASRRS